MCTKKPFKLYFIRADGSREYAASYASHAAAERWAKIILRTFPGFSYEVIDRRRLQP